MSKKILSSLLVLIVACSTPLTVYAQEESFEVTDESLEITEEEATEGYDVTAEVESNLDETIQEVESENDRLISLAAQDVLNGQVVQYTTSAEISRLVQLGYACHGNAGPISITKGVFTYYNWWWPEEKEVYLICLSGTDTDAVNTTTGYWTDLLSGFEFDNKYVQNVKKAVQENIPAGANIIIAGHSLGGMVAQQVAAEKDLKNNYNILNTVTFGSPLIDGFIREGVVKRLGDSADIVPYLSVSTILNIFWQAGGLNTENGNYGLNLHGAHCESYNRDDVWGEYDVVGQKNGGCTLSLDFSTTAFYASPVVIYE